MKQDKFTAEGEVVKCERGNLFRVKLDTNEHEILAHASGKISMNHIKILEGDRVQVEMDAYDLSRGRIVYRHKGSVPDVDRNHGRAPH